MIDTALTVIITHLAHFVLGDSINLKWSNIGCGEEIT